MNGEEAVTFMMLPNDLVLNCLARVSRLYYPTLSLVCKKFRSMLASRELYQTRTLLGRTDSCLYVRLKPCDYYDCGGIPQRWFILYQRPGSSKKVLVPITSPNSPSTYKSSCASVGSNIYVIGGTTRVNDPSSSVMVMDCSSHTWREAPSMQLARMAPSVCVLDEKIYVIGGCRNSDAKSWMEVFDTKTQTWEFELSCPDEDICSDFTYQSIGYDGAVYVKGSEKHTTYKLNKGIWSAAELDLAMSHQEWYRPISYCNCVIDNVIYLYRRSSGMIYWYDSEQRCWNALNVLKILFGREKDAKVASYGGKLVVFWEEDISYSSYTQNMICCAEIRLEKRKNGKIWGKVEWSKAVSTTHVGSDVVAHVVVATF